ncbi:hypothetical protein DFJ43DRAFT_719994 [Lentinula guzmanii]|uniref:Uncharacterized protein n=1 Tax=Lentinula guzmanii TaxID=2804957 RepID=A0AA38J4K4_9AGAR|nr:hypothetical protein DFJ43DRAFT_719994 [Lentinula guzmanii]
MSSLAPPSTSATLVGDSFLNESCSKADWMDVTNSPLQNKREREDDDSLMLNHPLSSASKRSRWDVRRSPKIGKSLERFRSRSISPDRKLNNIPSGPRYKENGFLRNSTLRDDFRNRYRSPSVSQDGVRLERRENEDGGRSFRRTSPPPFTASYSGLGASPSSSVVLSSHRTYQQPASEPTATNNPAGQIGHDGTVGSATSTSSLLPISPVDLSKLLSAISTVTAAAIPSSDSLSISNNESPSTALPSTTNPDANAESNTSASPISMSDIDTLLKALPVAPSLPAPQQQVNESTSVAETGAGSTQAQTSAIASSSSRTPVVPMQTYYGQYGYPYSHPYPYQYPHSYPYPTMYTRPYAQSDPQTATAFLRSSASTTSSNLMDDSRIKEEPVDVSVNDSNHCPSQTEIELSSSRMPRIVQLRSELVRLKKEIQERAKRERTVLSELAELVEKLKTDFVLGELDREGLQGLELGSEIGMGFYEDDELTERPNLSAIEIELQSNILILQAQLSNEQTGRRQAEQAREDAEYAKREAESTLEEVKQRLSETERLMKEAEQKQENAEFAKTEFENKTKDARLSLKDAIERRRDAEQLRRTAEHARNIADERRKEAEEGWKDAEHDIRQANDRRREAEQASSDADKAKRRAESDKRNMDGQRQAAEQGRRDAEKGKWEMEKRWKDAELARERAEERVREAEGFVADVKRECRAPFVVPALMDAFLSVSKLTTQSGEVGRSLSETGDGSTEI